MTTRNIRALPRNEYNAMEYIPVPNTAQLDFIFNWDGQVCLNVLHYVKATPWTQTQLQELTTAAIVKYTAQFNTNNPTTLALNTVRATDLASENGPRYENGTNLPVIGSNGSPSLPNNCAVVITKRTAMRGRSFRGRIYHMGLTEGSVTGNIVIAASLSAIIARWATFLSLTITGDEPLMCVVSRYANKLPRSTGVATLVTNLTSDGTIDSQRRRLPGRGR